ncbi:hypothetical protein [Acetivibrio cellulolyticus]|uniref:hypothetical protein n=1 Tax=Acetivibrio cellulolyticus TaxID=35830 RepID=UPI0001E2DEDF|nr:hypothetical protein [Acetivibrio cellulolyticus]
MQKTKLGISVGLLGAALYFIGLMNFLGLILLAGYVLLFETNEWLKRSAVKAVAIVIGFTLVTVIIGIGSDVIAVLNNLLSWVRIPFALSWPLQIDSIVLNAVDALEKLVLLVLGFKAFTQGSITIGPIDKVVDKNI